MIALSGYSGASAIRIEQQRLGAIVELGNLAQHALRRVAVDDVTAAQNRERAETRAAAQQQPPRRIGQNLRGILDQELRVDAGDDLADARINLS